MPGAVAAKANVSITEHGECSTSVEQPVAAARRGRPRSDLRTAKTLTRVASQADYQLVHSTLSGSPSRMPPHSLVSSTSHSVNSSDRLGGALSHTKV